MILQVIILTIILQYCHCNTTPLEEIKEIKEIKKQITLNSIEQENLNSNLLLIESKLKATSATSGLPSCFEYKESGMVEENEYWIDPDGVNFGSKPIQVLYKIKNLAKY